jgi:hypothetical protein
MKGEVRHRQKWNGHALQGFQGGAQTPSFPNYTVSRSGYSLIHSQYDGREAWHLLQVLEFRHWDLMFKKRAVTFFFMDLRHLDNPSWEWLQSRLEFQFTFRQQFWDSCNQLLIPKTDASATVSLILRRRDSLFKCLHLVWKLLNKLAPHSIGYF